MQKITWQAAGLTDRGLVRKQNEDNYSISSDGRVFVVADGMGGTANGALASKLAVEELEKYREAHNPDLKDPDALKTWMCNSIAKANARVVEEQAKTKAQMGTTIVVAVQTDGLLHISHVGDSRAYLIRDGESKSITIDHSVVMEMVRLGKLTREQSMKLINYSRYIHAFKKFRVGLDFDITMQIKPRNISGLLLAIQGRRDYLVLQMVDGTMTFTVDNGRGPITAVFKPSSRFQFCDGNWHEIHGETCVLLLVYS